MVSGFRNADDFQPILGWELYQITLDKYHVMFFFEGGLQLLNVAHAFSYRAADRSADFTYEVYGPRKTIDIDRVLRKRVVKVEVRAKDRLALIFENGDELAIHDSPELRSWWILPVRSPSGKMEGWSFGDDEVD
jgi:hypothetical protein